MKMCSFYKIKEKILRMTLVNIQKILTNLSKRKIKEIKIRNSLDNLKGFWYDNNIKKEKKIRIRKEEIPLGTLEEQLNFNMDRDCIFHTVYL